MELVGNLGEIIAECVWGVWGARGGVKLDDNGAMGVKLM